MNKSTANKVLEFLPTIDQYCQEISLSRKISAYKSMWAIYDNTLSIMQTIIEKTYAIQQLENFQSKFDEFFENLGEGLLDFYNQYYKVGRSLGECSKILGRSYSALINNRLMLQSKLLSYMEDKKIQQIDLQRLAKWCPAFQNLSGCQNLGKFLISS